MTIAHKKEPIVLLLGDVIFFFIALWITLTVRYFEVPDYTILYNHAVPFSLLFVVWILVFNIAGLYGKHTIYLKNKIPDIILKAQIANVSFAALFFFFVPYFGITPKTNLFIYLIISSLLIIFWRLILFPLVTLYKRQSAILIGTGKEVWELESEVNNNNRYNFNFALTVDLSTGINPNTLQQEVLEYVAPGNASILVCDTKNEQLAPLLPLLYNLTFLNTSFHFIDIHKLYEDIFDRIPLSLIQYHWFLDNISTAPKLTYVFLKRVTDVAVSLLLGTIAFLFFPFIYLAIKLDDGGKTFIVQERVGRNNKPVSIIKYRTMARSDSGDEVLNSDNTITRVGDFLRKTRLDELPQLINVLKGDLSLIGPRPELPALAKHYAEKIPYYNTRHVIKPGLSGWAQIYHDNHPHHGSDITETKVKLAYDLYYIKNRSFLLDLQIGLKTIKTLLSRSGL